MCASSVGVLQRKGSYVDSKDEPELCFLCRAGESDALFLKASSMCREANFHAKTRSEGDGEALTHTGEYQSTAWPKAQLCSA